MKQKIIGFIFCTMSVATTYAMTPIESARVLAEKGMIVNHSTSTMTTTGFVSPSQFQSESLYRLNDALMRQEALGIIAKMVSLSLRDGYICRNYFWDTQESWVCRAAEISADNGFVSRSNRFFRPRDTLTVAEAFWLLVKSHNFSMYEGSISHIQWDIPDWQKRLIVTVNSASLWLGFQPVYNPAIGSNEYQFVLDNAYQYRFLLSRRITRWEFFQIASLFLWKKKIQACESYDFQSCPISCQPVCISSWSSGGISTSDCANVPGSCKAKSFSLEGCSNYNDGCNDCFFTDNSSWVACTERACFAQGIPYCTACKSGYILQWSQCVKNNGGSCASIGGNAGDDVSGLACCGNLTRVKNMSSVPVFGGMYTCINQWDNICDTRYENEINSSDCRETKKFDSTICQSYYDGCNSCTNGADPYSAICTLRYCSPDQYQNAYCRDYKSYTPTNQEKDQEYLRSVLGEIQNYTKDLSCTENSQCQWKLFGNSPCGWSSVWIRYSSKNIDANLYSEKTSYYTKIQTTFNQSYPVFGACVVMSPPAPMQCLSGICQ